MKNVTAAYSRKLNDIIARSNGRYSRASLGRSNYTFEPNLDKTFSRGFTHYFADGRSADMSSPLTPKAIGQYVGTVKSINRNDITVAGTAAFSNGDGLCFFNGNDELQGFRVNRAQGNTIFPQRMPSGLNRGQALYRNSDQAFEKLLTGRSAERKINITMSLKESAPGNIILTATADSVSAITELQCEPQTAQKPQTDNIVRQLTRLGNTPFKCTDVSVPQDGIKTFIPSSLLSHMRRDIIQNWSKPSDRLQQTHERRQVARRQIQKQKKAAATHILQPIRICIMLPTTRRQNSTSRNKLKQYQPLRSTCRHTPCSCNAATACVMLWAYAHAKGHTHIVSKVPYTCA